MRFKRELVSFREAVIAQNEAIMKGRNGNQYAQKQIRAIDSLFAHGDEGRDALATLLVDERPDVKAMAAAFLLRHRHTEAMSVLKEVSKLPGLAGFGASECIKRWNEGAWQLDPGPMPPKEALVKKLMRSMGIERKEK